MDKTMEWTTRNGSELLDYFRELYKGSCIKDSDIISGILNNPGVSDLNVLADEIEKIAGDPWNNVARNFGWPTHKLVLFDHLKQTLLSPEITSVDIFSAMRDNPLENDLTHLANIILDRADYRQICSLPAPPFLQGAQFPGASSGR